MLPEFPSSPAAPSSAVELVHTARAPRDEYEHEPLTTRPVPAVESASVGELLLRSPAVVPSGQSPRWFSAQQSVRRLRALQLPPLLGPTAQRLVSEDLDQ